MSDHDKILTPELLRILKIFGLSSMVIVLLLSFFNEHRADNTGDASPTHMTSSNHIYFKNVRQIAYEREKRDDAKMDIFRLKKRIHEEEMHFFNLSIIISRIKDEAYIFVEPSQGLSAESPLSVRWHRQKTDTAGKLTFYAGDRLAHLQFVEAMYPLMEEEEISFEAEVDGEWKEIMASSKAREAFSTTASDYFRLIK